jgi:alkylated DNA repair protein alkB family protein 1
MNSNTLPIVLKRRSIFSMGRKQRLLKRQQELKRPDDPSYANTCPFRVKERAFKRRFPCSCPKEAHLNGCGLEPLLISTLIDPQIPSDKITLVRDNIYTFPDIPGLYLLTCDLSIDLQKQLLREALNDYSNPPNKTNLDAHYHVQSGLWKKYMEGSQEMLELKEEKEHDDPLLKPMSIQQAVHKWRWASLGYYYDWSTKEYVNLKYPQVSHGVQPDIPSLVHDLTLQYVQRLESFTHYPASQYHPEAGIVNYYGRKDALMAHQDRSETNATAPLVSFSIGNSAIFLIGTEDRQEEPLSLVIRSGDVLVMAGPCRRSFHGKHCLY